VFIVNTRTVSDALLIAFCIQNAVPGKAGGAAGADEAHLSRRGLLAAVQPIPVWILRAMTSWASAEVAATVEMNAAVTRAGNLVTRVNGMNFSRFADASSQSRAMR
jgi:hypothetical protein